MQYISECNEFVYYPVKVKGFGYILYHNSGFLINFLDFQEKGIKIYWIRTLSN